MGETTIRHSIPAYQNQIDFELVLQEFLQLLEDSAQGATTWLDVLDMFMGKNQVQLLTIQKSKGLEYRAVFVLGLDNCSWRSLKNRT